MQVVTFGGDRRALKFGRQKINLHPAEGPHRSAGLHPTPGSADLCFITIASIQKVVAHLERVGVRILEGRVARTGAVGPITSVYFRDPDSNLIELSVYDRKG
jgi:catechol 2,3-dioxygenase-like lactoylglutathione lyase family enzyme